MSLSPTSSQPAAYASLNPSGSGGGAVLKAIEAVPGRIVDGVENVGEAMGEAASATVSFSARAMQALADGGVAVAHGVENVIAFPFEMAADAAIGVEHAVEGGVHMLSNGVHAAINGVEAVAHAVANAAHAVAVDLPAAVAEDVSDLTNAALGNASTVAGAAMGVAALTGASPVKMLSAIL